MHTPGVYGKHGTEISFPKCSKNLPYTANNRQQQQQRSWSIRKDRLQTSKGKKKKRIPFTEELNHLENYKKSCEHFLQPVDNIAEITGMGLVDSLHRHLH